VDIKWASFLIEFWWSLNFNPNLNVYPPGYPVKRFGSIDLAAGLRSLFRHHRPVPKRSLMKPAGS
jgi:hypothetical protein